MSERLGKVRYNNYGLEMEIVGYRNDKDIDVLFESGVLKKHVTYSSFRHGILTDVSNEKVRLWKVNYNKEGKRMEIVGYRNDSDLDVKFESGVIRYSVSYASFVTGKLTERGKSGRSKRGSRPRKSRLKVERIGEENYNNSGDLMKVNDYKGCKNIDVKFDDGVVRKKMQYAYFKDGSISHYENEGLRKPRHKGTRVGEVGVSTYGEKMTIIGYRGYSDMDVKFEDGTIRTGVTYDKFQEGHGAKIRKISDRAMSFRVGETNRNTQGYLMTIIRYRSVKSIDVAFEDGTIRTGVMYKNFKKGLVAKR